MRTTFQSIVALVLAILVVSGASSNALGDKVDRPNIILLMADDLGYETVGAYGGESHATPNLDKMAAAGIRFEHCYAQPLCTPSRAKIMTGIYNVRNYVRFGLLDRKQTTFAHLLKGAGYATCVVGKWQLGKEEDSARHFGFDESCLWQNTRGRTNERGCDSRFENPSLEINGEPKDYRNGEYGPDVVSDYACDFIERNKDEAFLVYYPMILTHCPFVPTPDSDEWDPKSPGSKTYRGDPKYFGDMVTYMDKIVGKLATKLDELDIRDNTLILFTGDNGTDMVTSIINGKRFAGMKGSMTDGGTRVPLIASWPGTIPAGRVTSDIVDFSDFLPTMCEAAGVEVPEKLNVDGRSFLPQLLGKQGTPRDWIYIWYSRTGNADRAKVFARDQRYKLYRTGMFYDVSQDALEKRPLNVETLGDDVKQTHAMLRKALDKYENARPAHLNGEK
jgi:arylsulfatase A